MQADDALQLGLHTCTVLFPLSTSNASANTHKLSIALVTAVVRINPGLDPGTDHYCIKHRYRGMQRDYGYYRYNEEPKTKEEDIVVKFMSMDMHARVGYIPRHCHWQKSIRRSWSQVSSDRQNPADSFPAADPPAELDPNTHSSTCSNFA